MEPKVVSRDSFGQQELTWVDRLGVFLSQRAICKHLPSVERLDIIDLGCGYHATTLTALPNAQRKRVGVDFQITPELKRNPHFIFIEDALEQAMPAIEDASFDVVLLISVLEHVWNPAAVLKHCCRILRPGGVFLVNVPTWWGKVFLEFSAFTIGTSPKLEMDDHKMYYDKRDLWPLLVAAGFKPSQIALRYHKFGLNLFAQVQKEKETAFSSV